MTTDTTTDEETVLALHASWIAANRVGDTAWLRDHIAPGGPGAFLFFNHNGSNYDGVDETVALWEHLTRAALAAPTPPKRLVLDDRDVRVTVVGDIAIVTYLAWFEADFGEAGKEETGSRGTEVWRRTDDGWRLVHLHASVHTPGVNGGS